MTATCSHNSAAPRLCPDCRQERLTGRPVLPLPDAVAVLAEHRPARMLAEGDIDYAEVLKADMRQILDRIGWACLPADDLRALLNSAVYGVSPQTDVVMRAAEALSAEPRLYVVSTNAVPADATSADHGSKQAFTNPPPD